ncbi:PadR family transcriptional regulator [Gloeobacter violaceus]|nr:PadR family transcriptional regulator [Gloeobacter violaceus]
MPDANADPVCFIPLTPAVFHILLAVAECDRHGYGVMRAVEEYSGGKLKLGPGILYGSLKQLLASGWIEEVAGPGGERRRYYRLSEFGKRVAAAEAQRLSNLLMVARANQLLPGVEGAP